MNKEERAFMCMVIRYLRDGMKPLTVKDVHMHDRRKEYLKMEAIKVYELGI